MAVHERYSNYLSDQSKFFDELITEDWHTYSSDEWDQTRRFEIDQLFTHIQPRTVLDIGCGCGFHDVEMAQYPFVESVHGIDPSSASVARANEIYTHAKVKRSIGSFETLSSDSAYDLAVSIDVFEHTDKPDDYFENVKRVVHANGHIAIITPNRHRWSNLARRATGKKPLLISTMHWREYTFRELIALGQQHGLKHTLSFGHGFYGPMTGWMSHEQRLKVGATLPSISHVIGVVFQRPA
jgi:2-polyprenyl-3-methyl-5-hydroxy-6-metoxy-1,4-benzoquinol methylase